MRSKYETAVEKAELALLEWDGLSLEACLDAPSNYEIGAGHAANLRGTLKNRSASVAAIESLTSDVQFRLDCIARASGGHHEISGAQL